MLLEHFTYNLPADRIAERPVRPYDHAKLLVARRATASLEDSQFYKLTDYLKPRDVLVFNNSGVRKSRLLGEWADSGGSVEVLLLKPKEQDFRWLAMGKPLSKFKVGRIIQFNQGKAKVLERVGEREVVLEFEVPGDFQVWLNEVAYMPIPPYIRGGIGDEQDNTDYQTSFAQDADSVAASTAALHFTPKLLSEISSAGVVKEFINLRLGPASFLPVWDPASAIMAMPGKEAFFYSNAQIQRIKNLKASGHRIVAVGTSSVRALESAFRMKDVTDGIYETELFIQPGFDFLAVDALITNFHQPGTTHLMLVQSLLGLELLDKCYKHALESNYRFLSYGDGMFIC